jgi:hypothetical protein
MAEQVQSHQTNLEIEPSVPAEVDAATEISILVKVSCPSACNLQGKKTKVLAQDGSELKEAELSHLEDGSNATEEFKLRVPAELGTYSWRVVFPAQEVEGIAHEESSTTIKFNVKAHRTSMAVWDYPSPATMNRPFQIKVGVSCPDGCKLTGTSVEIDDDKGVKQATGRLGDTPWQQTTSLYWAEVQVQAPAAEGVYSWTAKYPAGGLELPHEGSSSGFVFRTARPPEHVVTVKVTGSDTKAPLRDAAVILHPYRGETDENGVAKVGVPKGDYEVYVSKTGYATYESNIKVIEDTSLETELSPEIQMF